MEINQLRYFCAVASCNSLIKASESLYVTQSTLSKAITQLEDELGIKLFDRIGGNRVQLNAHGSRFYKRVSQAFSELDEAAREVSKSEEDAGEIWFGSPQSDLLSSYILEFSRQYPQMQIHQLLLSHEDSLIALQKRQIDFALSFFPPDDPMFIHQPLLHQQLLLLVGRTHPLGNKANISLAELKDYQFVANNSCTDFQRLCNEYCAEAGFKPKLFFEAEAPFAIQQLLLSGQYCSFIPSFNQMRLDLGHDLRGAHHDEINWLKLADRPYDANIGITTVKNRYLTKSVRLFIDYIKTSINNECSTHMDTYLWDGDLNWI